MKTKNMSTDEAIILALADNDGEMSRRDLLRKFGGRLDYGQALMRLVRTKRIELLSKVLRGRKPQNVVRLIGENDTLLHGVGFVRITKRD